MEKSFQLLQENFHFSEEVIEQLRTENTKLKAVISSFGTALDPPTAGQPRLETKTGKHYSLPIRKLYYELLAHQIPSSKVSALVRSVVECFLPDVDISTLQLPKERCAGYMRRDELCTVEMAHKAHHFCSEIATGKSFHLNSDGTTLNQHKINAISINDVVFSLNEVPDGRAVSAIQDIEKEIIRLRNIAIHLKLPFANSINFTLFASSTSDSASTQKKFNKLLEEKIADDEAEFGAYTGNGLDLIKNFRAMHLGVNLRKAFVKSISTNAGNSRQNSEIDTLSTNLPKSLEVMVLLSIVLVMLSFQISFNAVHSKF